MTAKGGSGGIVGLIREEMMDGDGGMWGTNTKSSSSFLAR
jgi:hypothetical protein